MDPIIPYGKITKGENREGHLVVKIGTNWCSPRGPVLSPLVFVLFVADLEEWLDHSSAPTYADDTTTGTPGRSVKETIDLMQIDAEKVLRFMASNGLVANAEFFIIK